MLNSNAPFYKKKAERIQSDFIYVIEITGTVSVFFSKKFPQLSVVNVPFVYAFLKFFNANRHVLARFEHDVLMTQAGTGRRGVVFADNAARQGNKIFDLIGVLEGRVKKLI